jgi:thiaminase/transcriptional activator TenA
MLAVLVVAEWSYLDWAAPHADKARDLPFWFGEWITLHSGEGFEGVVAYLRDQLDAVWPGLPAQEQRAVEATFARATRLERVFFDAALAGYPET